MALNQLFASWRQSYPRPARSGFHADGIVDESRFLKQKKHILFVLTEPNSTGGRFDRFYGADIRKLFRQKHSKLVTRNLGLWTRVLLDGESRYCCLCADDVRTELSRIAVMNLKKFSGSSKPDYAAVGVHAWHDRNFIKQEVAIIDPDLILTCGEWLHRLFGTLMHNDRFWPGPSHWRWNGAEVFNVQHPATRGRNTIPAFRRVLEIARRHRP